MGVATAAGAEELPKHPGACDCCVKIEKLSYHLIDSGLKMTYYPKKLTGKIRYFLSELHIF